MIDEGIFLEMTDFEKDLWREEQESKRKREEWGDE